MGISQVIMSVSYTKISLHKLCQHVLMELKHFMVRTCKFLACLVTDPSIAYNSGKDNVLSL